MNQPNFCERQCACRLAAHAPQLIVVTGGPGAGKTAVLEMAKKHFCEHTAIVPEAASIVFGGGFWRLPEVSAKLAAQRAIYHVQREMEAMVLDEKRWALGLCDRGTLDGLAYWPGTEDSFWSDLKSDKTTELSRYAAVIHLQTPGRNGGYNHRNSLRIETAEEAHIIDEKMGRIWSEHPRYVQISSTKGFLEKAKAALEQIQLVVPSCCRINGGSSGSQK